MCNTHRSGAVSSVVRYRTGDITRLSLPGFSLIIADLGLGSFDCEIKICVVLEALYTIYSNVMDVSTLYTLMSWMSVCSVYNGAV